MQEGGEKVHKIIKYFFTITSNSLLYFGDSGAGEIIKDADGKPMIFGNSIGGSIRNYFESIDVPDNSLYG